jgi:hypothetical protein
MATRYSCGFHLLRGHRVDPAEQLVQIEERLLVQREPCQPVQPGAGGFEREHDLPLHLALRLLELVRRQPFPRHP